MTTKITEPAGETTSIFLTEVQKENFWRFVDRNGPLPDQTNPHYAGLDRCWTWTGAQLRGGYGGYTFQRDLKPTTISAHRLMWILKHGQIEKRLKICHICDNGTGGCVNPAHLFIGTHRDNMLDMHKKGRQGDRPTGDDHWTRTNPEKLLRGEDHYFHAHPFKGEDNKNSRLTASQVLEIRAKYDGSYGGTKALAEEYGVKRCNIWRIVTRINWKHI